MTSRSQPFRTKPGKYGLLYLYAIDYTCPADPIAFGTRTAHLWAYCAEHALERFQASDEGFEVARFPRRERDRSL